MKKICPVISLLALPFLLSSCGGNTAASGSQDEVSVYISNGAKQCEFMGIPASQTRQNLVDAGIDVLDSRCAHINGMAVITMCGAGSTSINVHKIGADNLQNAISLGFKAVEGLADGYSETKCRE